MKEFIISYKTLAFDGIKTSGDFEVVTTEPLDAITSRAMEMFTKAKTTIDERDEPEEPWNRNIQKITLTVNPK